MTTTLAILGLIGMAATASLVVACVIRLLLAFNREQWLWTAAIVLIIIGITWLD